MSNDVYYARAQHLLRSNKKCLKTGVKVFRNIATRWRISPAQQLAMLGCDSTTLNRWLEGDVYVTEQGETVDVLLRISHVLAIYRSLSLLYDKEVQADSWPQKSNKAFGGRTAAEVMIFDGLDGLQRVHRYLDDVCGH